MYTHVHLMSADVLMFTGVPSTPIHPCTLVYTHYTHIPSSILTFTCDNFTMALYFIVPITRSFHVHFAHWCTDEVPWNYGLKSCHIIMDLKSCHMCHRNAYIATLVQRQEC